MKKIILSLILCAAGVCSLMAQDVVYLKNGNVVKGEVKKNDATTVEIVSNGNTLTYKAIDVQKVQIGSTAVTMPETPKRPAYKDYDTAEKGYWTAVEIWGGGAVDFGGKPNMCNIDIHWINGYRFNEWIRVGVGLGFRYYLGDLNFASADGRSYPEPISSGYNWTDPFNTKEGLGGSQWALPLYIDVRGNIMSMATRMCVPYWSFDAGYTFSGKFVNQAEAVKSAATGDDPRIKMGGDKLQGQGFFFAPTLGIKIVGPRHTVLLGISYMGQILPRYSDYTAGTQTQAVPYVSAKYTNFLMGRVAYEF